MLEHGFYLMDCMDGMKQFPDGFFDLAIVDPPYGDGNQKIGGGYGSDRGSTDTSIHYQRKNCRKPDGTWGYANWRNVGDEIRKKIVAWDVAPEQDYFDELFRVSRYQIIWGGNYFNLPPSRNFIIWRKLSISENFSMAMAEYAWTNIIGNAKVFECTPQGKANEQRFHPTQKPVALYTWLLSKYAKPGMKILDTHVGSASSLIACHRAGLEYWGFEIDPVYYKAAKERLERETAQVNIMDILQGEST